jgi:hypothetical protein
LGRFVSLSSRDVADDTTNQGEVGTPYGAGPIPKKWPWTTERSGLRRMTAKHVTERIPAMLRFKLALLAAALSAGAVGCSQCDTCDDFPTPCIGGNCGPQSHPPTSAGDYSMVAPGQGAPIMLPQGAPMPPAPPASTTEPATPPPAAGSPATPPPAEGPEAMPPAAAAGAISVPPASTDVSPPPPDSVGSLPSPIR